MVPVPRRTNRPCSLTSKPETTVGLVAASTFRRTSVRDTGNVCVATFGLSFKFLELHQCYTPKHLTCNKLKKGAQPMLPTPEPSPVILSNICQLELLSADLVEIKHVQSGSVDTLQSTCLSLVACGLQVRTTTHCDS